MMTIAIIPARGGSKGIPGKNLKPVGGVPLLARTIRIALSCSDIAAVYVSTDASEIAELARREGAGVIERPEELSSDTASSESGLLHALDVIEQEQGGLPETFFFLQCTSPFLEAADLDGALAKFQAEQADSLFSGAEFFHFIWQAEGDPQTGAIGINHDKHVRLRRQERQGQVVENGALYLMKTAGFRQHQHRFFGKTVCYRMPASRSLEVDEPVDLVVAEAITRHQSDKDRSSALPAHPGALVFDFDGVFTDNRVWTDQDGTESVACSRSDGLRFPELRQAYPELQLLILSKEPNPVVLKRADKLKLPVLHGVDDKVAVLDGWLAERSISWKDCIYVGNDLNDLGCIEKAGCGVAVGDAYPEVKAAADLVLQKHGGQGAVRELVDLLLGKQPKA